MSKQKNRLEGSRLKISRQRLGFFSELFGLIDMYDLRATGDSEEAKVDSIIPIHVRQGNKIMEDQVVIFKAGAGQDFVS